MYTYCSVFHVYVVCFYLHCDLVEMVHYIKSLLYECLYQVASNASEYTYAKDRICFMNMLFKQIQFT